MFIPGPLWAYSLCCRRSRVAAGRSQPALTVYDRASVTPSPPFCKRHLHHYQVLWPLRRAKSPQPFPSGARPQLPCTHRCRCSPLVQHHAHQCSDTRHTNLADAPPFPVFSLQGFRVSPVDAREVMGPVRTECAGLNSRPGRLRFVVIGWCGVSTCVKQVLCHTCQPVEYRYVGNLRHS